MILILLLILILVIFVILQNERHKAYFESQGIPYIGHTIIRLLTNTLKGITMHEDIKIQYDKHKADHAKLAGSYEFGTVALMILDPDLLKTILVKSAQNHFTDRRAFPIPKGDEVFSKMLLTQRGERWKALRSKLSPTFTTGKIRRLFALFDASGKKLAKFIEQEITASRSEMDLSLSYSKFTMDIIASAVCAMDSQAFDKKEPSLFERMGAKLQLTLGIVKIFQLIVLFMAPPLGNFLGFSLFEKEVQDFFAVGIKASITTRQEKGEKQNDFLQLMLEAKEGKLKTDESELSAFEKDAIIEVDQGKIKTEEDAELLDDDTIVANAVLFMVGGYDTVQSVLLFCAYSLALNQDVQDKLRAEIDSVLDENNGQFSYDTLNKMTYLDMVICETLRRYPPMLTDRGCTHDFKVPGTDFILKKGEGIIVPVYGLHLDPEYFPEPEKFDPERFSSANKSKINPFAYLPFGAGPRNCIGMRFALTEIKVAISHLVHNFKIEPSSKTRIPMKFAKTSSIKPEGGMFLALSKIQH